jgi:FixJ family two-component response regulator
VVSDPIHVAVLDDDPSVRMALVRLLRAVAMDAQAYATSGELFQSIALKRPNCLVLDLQMEEMDGLEVLNCLHQRNFRIPTIIISGLEGKASGEVCKSADVAGFLRKPLEADQLIRMIQKIAADPAARDDQGPLSPSPRGRMTQNTVP